MDNQLSNIVWNPSKIRILPHSLVMMCGLANSGKSTLAKKIFLEKDIINTDMILEKTAQELINITKKDLGLTPISENWSTISRSLGRVAILKSQQIIEHLIIDFSFKNDIIVLDAAPYYLENRMITITKFSPYFEQIYLIVLFPNIIEVFKRDIKPMSEAQKSLGFFNSSIFNISNENSILESQIKNETIAKNVAKSFIITELKCEPTIIC